MRGEAAWSLGSFRDKKSASEIKKLLNDSKTCRSSIFALGLIDAKEASPEIRKFLDSDDSRTRQVTVEALWKLGDKESIPRIKKLLNDEDKWVRKEAEIALKQLGVPEEEIQKAQQGK